MNRIQIYNELRQRIGNTNLLPLRNIPISNNNTIYCKYEFENPSGSHYDRVYYRLYHYYEIEKQIMQPGITPIIENTSGCAGAACAYIGKELGYETHIVAPGNLPKNRFTNILNHTPNLYYTHDAEYVLGTQKLLKELLINDHKNKNKNDPTRLFCLNHSQIVESVFAMEECGKEVVTDLSKTDTEIDYFVSAVGNGTSMLGIGNILRKKWHPQIIALDPVEAPVVHNLIEGDRKFKEYEEHELYGIGAWGIQFPFINIDFIDDTYTVAPREWEHALRLLIEREGLYVGHTSAASLAVALKIAETVNNKNILIILYDSIKNY